MKTVQEQSVDAHGQIREIKLFTEKMNCNNLDTKVSDSHLLVTIRGVLLGLLTSSARELTIPPLQGGK